MRARTRRTPADPKRLTRIAYDALRVANRARSLRDLVEDAVGPSPAADAAQEALNWAVEAAERVADVVGGIVGPRGRRPSIDGDDEREAMETRLERVHLDVGLMSRELERKRT